MASLSDEISSRRTFAIISHPDAGKTTLTEKLLLYTGSIQTAGSVKGKSSAKHAVSDWMDIEKERGISVTSSVLQFTYNGACVNILDTPGHQDFSEDTYRTLMAADAAVMVIDGAKGVEAQTKKLFKVCTLRHIPIFTFVNKLDHEARDPFELMEEIENVLGINTYPMNWPIGSGRNFRGVFDRQTRRVIAFEGDGHANATKKVAEVEAELGDPAMDELIGEENHKNLMDDIELLDGAGDELDLAGFAIHAFATSHDAVQSFGFRIECGGDAIGYVTDTGVVTPQAHEALGGCRLLAIEANHDRTMLAEGPYPYPLKRRIASERGHLSNEQAAEELASLLHDGLTAVVAMHVSENNNDYELPGKALREALVREGHGAAVHVARQRSLVSI